MVKEVQKKVYVSETDGGEFDSYVKARLAEVKDLMLEPFHEHMGGDVYELPDLLWRHRDNVREYIAVRAEYEETK